MVGKKDKERTVSVGQYLLNGDVQSIFEDNIRFGVLFEQCETVVAESDLSGIRSVRHNPSPRSTDGGTELMHARRAQGCFIDMV